MPKMMKLGEVMSKAKTGWKLGFWYLLAKQGTQRLMREPVRTSPGHTQMTTEHSIQMADSSVVVWTKESNSCKTKPSPEKDS